jgi:hypothetical protein
MPATWSPSFCLTPFPGLDRHSCTQTPEQEESYMVDILHKVGIESSSPDDAYKALTTLEGLSGGWTNDTQGQGEVVGGVIQFRFGAGGFDMKVLELQPTSACCGRWSTGPQNGSAQK